LSQIPNQVKTIGDLGGVGDCPAGPFGITAVPVPAYGRDPRVRCQPSRRCVRRALRQHIDHTPAF
jgi:hypothetical protein